MLLSIYRFKIKINSKPNSKSSRIEPKHPKWQIFIHAKIYSLYDIHSGTKKTCSERLHLVVYEGVL